MRRAHCTLSTFRPLRPLRLHIDTRGASPAAKHPILNPNPKSPQEPPMSDDLRAGATEDPHLPDRDIPNALVNSQGEFCFVYGDRDIHESLPIEVPMLPPLGGTRPIE